MYIRFQSPTANARGVHPGIFALVNGLAAEGSLSPEEERLRVEGNAWFEAHFTDPSTVDALVYDRELNPGAVAWFRDSSAELVARASGYLAVLKAHGVPCAKVASENPGRIVYEDADQIVVVPENEKRAATPA